MLYKVLRHETGVIQDAFKDFWVEDLGSVERHCCPLSFGIFKNLVASILAHTHKAIFL